MPNRPIPSRTAMVSATSGRLATKAVKQCDFVVRASPHDLEPVAERVEVDDPVVPDSKLSPIS